jgi:hypothetical protein
MITARKMPWTDALTFKDEMNALSKTVRHMQPGLGGPAATLSIVAAPDAVAGGLAL